MHSFLWCCYFVKTCIFLFSVFSYFLYVSVKVEIFCNVHGLMFFNHSVEETSSGFRCLDCAVLFFPAWMLLVCLVYHFHLSVWWSWGRHLLTIRFLSLSYLPRLFFLFETVTSTFPMSFLCLFTSYFFEESLVLSPLVSSPLHLSAYDSVYLQFFHSLSLLSSSSSSASSSAPSQIHLCLLSSLHVVAAIFSPYLEPDILSLLMILKRTPGRLLPEHAWSPISAPFHPNTP